jgi:hypothetical protein
MDIVQILSLIGIGSIIATFLTAWLNKTNELAFKIREQKLRRYKVILLFMDAHLTPENMKYLNNTQALFQHTDAHDVVESLKAEYRELFLYSSKEVIKTVKEFIEKPNNETFLAATMAMRKDLGMANNRIAVQDLSL